MRTNRLLALGIVTPALLGLPRAAIARSVDIETRNTTDSLSISSRDAAIRALQEGVFALTPAEKLTIGSGRIRVAENAIRSKTRTQSPRTQSRANAAHTPRTHAQPQGMITHSWFRKCPHPPGTPVSCSACHI
jgi:hypothetical protein